jgi:hypothetical protein
MIRKRNGFRRAALIAAVHDWGLWGFLTRRVNIYVRGMEPRIACDTVDRAGLGDSGNRNAWGCNGIRLTVVRVMG